MITEIVEEQVIEVESDESEQQNQMEYSNERDQRIQEYLDVDKDEYLNRNEYQDIAGEDANEEWGQHSNDGNRITEEARHLEHSPENKDYELENKYMDSQPIHEHTREEELSTLIRQRCTF